MDTAYLLCVLFWGRQILAQAECSIQFPKNDRKQNVYLKVFNWSTPIDNYNGTKTAVADKEILTLKCPNGFVNNDLRNEIYTFECNNGKFNNTFLYEDLLCKSNFHKNTRTFRLSSIQLGSKILKCDGKNLKVYQVNSLKKDGTLKHLYTVCFDDNIKRTKFVFQPKRLENFTRFREDRRDVWGFDYFGNSALEKLKLSEGYVAKIQRRRITSAFPNRYNRKNKYPYTFNRGHLAPYADFNDYDDKKASCEYINVAPQWKEFNGNSWSLVERETRELISQNPEEWEIYTGTYGSIPTSRGPLFVSPFFDDKGKFVKGFVPVPKLYWKLVHNILNKNNSRVFLGINNPELRSPQNFTNKYLVCKPKSDPSKKMFQGNEFKGFTFECDVNEFLEKLSKDEGVVKVKN